MGDDDDLSLLQPVCQGLCTRGRQDEYGDVQRSVSDWLGTADDPSWHFDHNDSAYDADFE